MFINWQPCQLLLFQHTVYDSMQTITSSVSNDSVVSSFLILYLINLLFPLLYWLGSGKSRDSCSFLLAKGSAFSISSLSVIFAVRLVFFFFFVHWCSLSSSKNSILFLICWLFILSWRWIISNSFLLLLREFLWKFMWVFSLDLWTW